MATHPVQLLRDALEPHGVQTCGVVASGLGQLVDGERVTLSDGLSFAIAHDEREAPVPVGDDGTELDNLLISISDEDDTRMLVWARPTPTSPVAGIGIDICSTEDFLEDDGGNRFSRLLFTEGEQLLVERSSLSVPISRAHAFSAKEAAFKACAPQLRRWYEMHDEELFFEAMDFELHEGGIARGTAPRSRGRTGRAERACERMGIARIEVSHALYEGMVLCVAVALRGRRD